MCVFCFYFLHKSTYILLFVHFLFFNCFFFPEWLFTRVGGADLCGALPFFFFFFQGLGVQTFCCNWRFILHTLPQKDCSQAHMHTRTQTQACTPSHRWFKHAHCSISIHMRTPCPRRHPEHIAKLSCSRVVPADSGTFTVTDRGGCRSQNEGL